MIHFTEWQKYRGFSDCFVWQKYHLASSYYVMLKYFQLVLNSNPLLDVQEWSGSEKGANETMSGYNSSEVASRVQHTLAKDNIKLAKDRNRSWDLLG